jgi:hypothetical protein
VRVAIVAVRAVARGAIVVNGDEGGGGVGDRVEGERVGGPRNASRATRSAPLVCARGDAWQSAQQHKPGFGPVGLTEF